MPTAAQRFWRKVATDPAGCWEWTAARSRNGYGRFVDEHGRLVQAHRWAYGYVVGVVSDELVLDHLCRNVGCVRPDHLDPVVQASNRWRGENDGRPRDLLCRKGHPLTVGNVDVRPDGGRRCSTCRRARENAANARRLVGVAA